MKSFLIFLLLLVSGFSYGQIFSEIVKVVAFDREVSDRFGYSVDISGNYAVVGAYSDDFGGADPNMGSAYIFEKDGIADWEFVQKINNSDQDDYDRFGWSVAIDGDYIVVGAYAEDHDVSDGANLSKAGSAYIFERDGLGVWNEVQKIVPSDRQAEDEFGWSVDISGSTIVVGAHFESHDESGGSYIYHTGSAYLFDRAGDGTWSQSQKIVGSGRAADIEFPDGGGGDDLSDLFGGSVSISGDRLIVGAHHHDYDASGGDPLHETGAAYIFERSGGVWGEVIKLQNSDRSLEDRFGFSVSIDANYAVVSAHTEDHNIGGTGTMTNSGSIYIFERNISGIWSQIQKVVASDRSPGDRFGWDVYIDGETIVVGSIRSDTDDSDTAPLSDAGSAYSFIFDSDVDSWIELNKIDASDRQVNDRLGVSVAVSGNGIILGAFQQDFDETGATDISNAGAAYFYSQEECTPSSSSQTLTLCAGKTVEVGVYSHSETGVFVDVIFSESGCDSTVTTDLTILTAPSSSQEASICFGYSFNIGESSHTETGVYTDTLSNMDGCDSIVHTDLTVSPENAVSQDVTICWGESYIIGASTYYTAGTYTDIITSWTLCDCTITTNLSVQLPVDKSISQSLSTLSAGSDAATYQWIKCSPYEEISGATDQTYIAPSVGVYAVVVTEGVCTDTSSCIFVDVLGISNVDALNEFHVYPNPTNGTFTIDIDVANKVDYDAILYDTMGKVVHEFRLNKTSTFVNYLDLPKGVYILTIKNETTVQKIRLILK